MSKTIVGLIFFVVCIVTLASFYKDNILAAIVPGYENNSICKSHELIASNDFYEIPSSMAFSKGLIVKVEDWGDFNYTYGSLKFDVNRKECVASSVVTPNEDSGVLISLGNNFNSGYKPFVKIRLDLYLYAMANSDDTYDAEQVLKDLANNFIMSKNLDGEYELKLKETKASDVLSTKGAWVFQSYENGEMFKNETFKLLSKDGATWSFLEDRPTE
jgi:hypothetical protein